MPIHGLFADVDLGQGCVVLPDDFVRLCGAIQLDVIADWQRALEGARKRAIVKLYRDTTQSSGDLDLPAKLERFRHTCKAMGIAYPSDMALMLQQY